MKREGVVILTGLLVASSVLAGCDEDTIPGNDASVPIDAGNSDAGNSDASKIPSIPPDAGFNDTLRTAASGLAPGAIVALDVPSLAMPDSSGTYSFDSIPSSGGFAVLDWANKMAWDGPTQSFYMSGGRPYASGPANKVIWYDARTNLFDSQNDPFAGVGGGHLYDAHDVAEQHRALLRVPYGSAGVYVWNVDSHSFERVIAAPPSGQEGGWSPVTAVAWHPLLGAQGSIIWHNSSRMRIMRYDWATQTWSRLALDSTLQSSTLHLVAVYVPAAQVVVTGASIAAGQPLSVVHADGSVTPTAASPFSISCNGSTPRGHLLAHPSRPEAWAFDYDHKRIGRYIVAEDRWEDRAPLPAELDSVYTIGGTIPDLGVMLFVKYGSGGKSKAYLYRPLD